MTISHAETHPSNGAFTEKKDRMPLSQADWHRFAAGEFETVQEPPAPEEPLTPEEEETLF